jgi:hypothetical protein
LPQIQLANLVLKRAGPSLTPALVIRQVNVDFLF